MEGPSICNYRFILIVATLVIIVSQLEVSKIYSAKSTVSDGSDQTFDTPSFTRAPTPQPTFQSLKQFNVRVDAENFDSNALIFDDPEFILTFPPPDSVHVGTLIQNVILSLDEVVTINVAQIDASLLDRNKPLALDAIDRFCKRLKSKKILPKKGKDNEKAVSVNMEYVRLIRIILTPSPPKFSFEINTFPEKPSSVNPGIVKNVTSLSPIADKNIINNNMKYTSANKNSEYKNETMGSSNSISSSARTSSSSYVLDSASPTAAPTSRTAAPTSRRGRKKAEATLFPSLSTWQSEEEYLVLIDELDESDLVDSVETDGDIGKVQQGDWKGKACVKIYAPSARGVINSLATLSQVRRGKYERGTHDLYNAREL